MKINEIIRIYRKKQNLTQEQVANYLGVTAPAVNKWENGNSYPDITLLAPLARILHTNVDTLLSFQEELTENEINQFIKELSAEIGANGYQATFDKASSKIREYPNCYQLILYVAQLMNAYLMMGLYEVRQKDKCQKQIKAWLEMVAFGENKELANMAIMSLSQDYMLKGEYVEAQNLLDQIPPMGFDKRPVQASLYSKQGQLEKAYEIHESMIYQNLNGVASSLMLLSSLLCEEQQYELAMEYANRLSKLTEEFDMGIYMGLAAKMDIYLKMQDEENSLKTIEAMLEVGLDSIRCAKESSLYRHMKFQEDSTLDMESLFKKSLLEDKNIDFLRDHAKFKELISKL